MDQELISSAHTSESTVFAKSSTFGCLNKARRDKYVEFWDEVVLQSYENEDLFNETLFPKILDIIKSCAGMQTRQIRFAATEAGMQLITSLINVANILSETRDIKQRHLDMVEINNKHMDAMDDMEEAVTICQKRVESVESMMTNVFNSIFPHRFRDIDPTIRASCINSMGHWICNYPLMFLSDFYMKVRTCVVYTLLSISHCFVDVVAAFMLSQF